MHFIQYQILTILNFNRLLQTIVFILKSSNLDQKSLVSRFDMFDDIMDSQQGAVGIKGL